MGFGWNAANGDTIMSIHCSWVHVIITRNNKYKKDEPMKTVNGEQMAQIFDIVIFGLVQLQIY